MKKSDLRTSLARVRGLGSAKEGVHHWIAQRVTAIALIPLTFWFISSLLSTVMSDNRASIVHWLSSGLHASALIILLIAVFYHAKLGLQVIIEDYLHCPYSKFTALLLNMFINYALAIISILAVLKLHFQILPHGAIG